MQSLLHTTHVTKQVVIPQAKERLVNSLSEVWVSMLMLHNVTDDAKFWVCDLSFSGMELTREKKTENIFFGVELLYYW